MSNRTIKNAQCHSSSGKCKRKPQWAATSHLFEWRLWERQKATSVYKEVGREPLCAVGEKVSCCRYYDTAGRVPSTSETELPQTQCSHFWEHVQRQRNQCLAVTSAVLCSLQRHSQWPRHGSQLVSAMVNALRECDIRVRECHSALKTRGSHRLWRHGWAWRKLCDVK